MRLRLIINAFLIKFRLTLDTSVNPWCHLIIARSPNSLSAVTATFEGACMLDLNEASILDAGLS